MCVWGGVGIETCAYISVCLKTDVIDCCECSKMSSKVRK